MRTTIYCITAILFLYSCKKDHHNEPAGNNGPELFFDSLKTINSNIPNAAYVDLFFLNETTGYAIAHGRFVKTIDAGQSWTSTLLPPDIYVSKVQFTDSQHGYIIGGDNNHGFLLKSTDAGQSWTTINLNSLEAPTGIHFLDNNNGYITGKNLFSKTSDGGLTWTSLKTPSFKMFQRVSFRNPNEGVATCSNGVYYRTTNGGANWDSLRFNTPNYLYDIYFTGNKTLITLSYDSIVDVQNNFAITKRPYNASKLLFVNPQRSIGIGSHFETGFYPYGDIMITNDGWKHHEQKTFTTTEAIAFTGIAQMTPKKVMIIGYGFAGTKLLTLNW